MPKEYSLKRKKHFDELFKKGKRVHSKNFTLTYLPSKETLFAYIAPKKIIKTAVKRNYSKRIIREIVRKEILEKLSSNFHIAILVKSDIKELRKVTSFNEIKNELVSLFTRIN